MNHEDRRKLYAALAAPFPPEAIERTEGRLTGRGYDTTGIKYQYVCNRLNEVLGVGGFKTERTITTKEITTAKGRPAFEAVCELRLQLGVWDNGTFVAFAESIGDGGHTSTSLSDAIKGAYTNGFKKAAGFLGVGRQAYEGSLDDDHVPLELPSTHMPTGAPATIRSQSTQSEIQGPASGPTETVTGVTAAPRPASTTSAGEQGPPQTLTAARNRLTSKQLGAIMAIARARGLESSQLRAEIRAEFGCQPEYLTRDQASKVIGRMTGNGNGNGATHERVVGQEG
jgi:hypothetical protein